jgi:hypothetical protein
MRSFHNSSFDPQTLVLLEAAFDEAWLTLKFIGNKTVKPNELARCVFRLAMEGERDPVRLHARRADRRALLIAAPIPDDLVWITSSCPRQFVKTLSSIRPAVRNISA